ncbi:hypothetical protein PM082_019680 [Marasmius tenuissimus]|nr:hypothetical protein PM082_019680 [Marasmius tenuissimus]
MASSFFAGATNTKIGPGSSFQNVEGDVHHHYDATYQEEEENRVMPRQKRYREVFEGDVLVGKQTWSQEMEVVIREREPLTDSVSFRDSGETRIAVVKRFHTATLYPHNYMVTVMTFEPKEKKDRETTRLLWEVLYKALSAHRTRQVVQMLGLMTAEMPTFILHEELVNGEEFVDRYSHTQRLVFEYLFYTQTVAISTLRADKSLRISVSPRPIRIATGEHVSSMKSDFPLLATSHSHLNAKNYDIDGNQYARDHGYPELIWGDPHARTIMELEDTDSDEDLENSNQHGDSEELDESCSSIFPPEYPSTSSVVDLPVERALAYTEKQDTRHETNVQNSVEETRRIRGQHSTVQETRCQTITSKDAPQRLTPFNSPTSVSNLAYKQPKPSEQGTTRETVDSRGDTSTRPTRSQTPREAMAGFNAQTQRSSRESE